MRVVNGKGGGAVPIEEGGRGGTYRGGVGGAVPQGEGWAGWYLCGERWAVRYLILRVGYRYKLG